MVLGVWGTGVLVSWVVFEVLNLFRAFRLMLFGYPKALRVHGPKQEGFRAQIL